MSRIVLFLLLFTFYFNGNAQIQWVTIEEATEVAKQNDKKIIIDVYTHWCGWCKKMDNTTFSDSEIITFINDNFIPVKFDAELKNTVSVNDVEYNFVEGYNEFAFKILRGNLQFPSLVFLDEDFNLIQPVPGYQEVEQLQMMMIYFSNDYHKKMSWDVFTKKYYADKKAKETKSSN